MTLRNLYDTTRPLHVPTEDDQALQRVARRIFSRQLNEGQPISMTEAWERATQAMYEVRLMAQERGIKR